MFPLRLPMSEKQLPVELSSSSIFNGAEGFPNDRESTLIISGEMVEAEPSPTDRLCCGFMPSGGDWENSVASKDNRKNSVASGDNRKNPVANEGIQLEVGGQQEDVPDVQLDEGGQQEDVPDGGFGWWVVAGCFLAHIVFGGLDRSEGVFFLLLTDEFHESAQLTAWSGAVVCTFQLVLGPVANLISERFSARVAVICGAVLMFLGQISSSFSPNFYFYFMFHAFLGGFGRGIAYVPGLVIVGKYFDKRAGLAVGIATAGTGLGTFLVVPLSQYLADVYRFQGTFLVLSAFSCHMFVAGLLYRPLSVHLKRKQVVKSVVFKQVNDNEHNIENSEDCQLEFFEENKHDIKVKVKSTSNSDEQTLSLHKIINENNGDHAMKGKPSPGSELTSISKGHSNRITAHQTCSHVLVPDLDDFCAASLKVCCPVQQTKRQSKKLFSFHLLQNSAFLMYCLSIFFFTMAFRAAFTFIPALIESKGITKSDAALALSFAGVVDTVGRVSAGFLMDLSQLRPFRLIVYNSVIFGVAFVAFLLPGLKTLALFYLVCSLYGLMTGAYISQKSVVLADILSLEDVPRSLGILMMFQGTGNLLGPPLSGALKDCFGSFDEAFYVGGGLLLVSGVLMAMCNVYKRLERCRGHQCKVDS